MDDAENPKTKPHIRAQCVRAWDILEERKRILRGKPLPGQFRPEGDGFKRKPKGPSLLSMPDVAPLPQIPSGLIGDGLNQQP